MVRWVHDATIFYKTSRLGQSTGKLKCWFLWKWKQTWKINAFTVQPAFRVSKDLSRSGVKRSDKQNNTTHTRGTRVSEVFYNSFRWHLSHGKDRILRWPHIVPPPKKRRGGKRGIEKVFTQASVRPSVRNTFVPERMFTTLQDTVLIENS